MSTPAIATEIDPPIPEPAVLEVTVELPVPVEVEKPEQEDLPKVTSTACNCYNILKERFDSVPSMAALESMATSTVGNVVFMKYPPTAAFPNGVPHVALVQEVYPDQSLLIEEYNFQSCTHSHRVIPHNYHRLIGFITL